jgi:rhamnogalacturonyl hydrolase YesR
MENVGTMNKVISNLWAWLETWIDDKGGVHGYIVHHNRDNLKILSPDTWTQSLCILGLTRLYQKTKGGKWAALASKLCEYLVDAYIPALHVYRNSNWDQKPLGRPSIDGNALASFALLEASKQLNSSERIRFIEVAKDNILNYLLAHWNNSVGAIESIYHGRRAFIHNKNSMAILALISLAEVENDKTYIKNYAKRIGNFIVSCQVKTGKQRGAFPYVDTAKDYRTGYTLITCLGLYALYKATNSVEYLMSIKDALENLKNSIDYKTGLICHNHAIGFPQWIPDTILFIFNAKLLEKEGIKIEFDLENIQAKLMSMQYCNGSFPLSIGFQDLSYYKGLPSKPYIKRWRDLLPTPSWNAWIFWALTELLQEKTEISEPSIRFPMTIKTDKEEHEGPYIIIEEESEVIFISENTKEIVGIFKKTNEIADVCLINERGAFWRTLEALSRYPESIRRLILAFPSRFL